LPESKYETKRSTAIAPTDAKKTVPTMLMILRGDAGRTLARISVEPITVMAETMKSPRNSI
jgi:hypothetical protein